MPFQERLTWDGVAIHAGRVPGYSESHGCVHLRYSFAKASFKEKRIGTKVMMTGEAPAGDPGASTTTASAAVPPALPDNAPIQATANTSDDNPTTSSSTGAAKAA